MAWRALWSAPRLFFAQSCKYLRNKLLYLLAHFIREKNKLLIICL